jgi:hypothetical protein
MLATARPQNLFEYSRPNRKLLSGLTQSDNRLAISDIQQRSLQTIGSIGPVILIRFLDDRNKTRRFRRLTNALAENTVHRGKAHCDVRVGFASGDTITGSSPVFLRATRVETVRLSHDENSQ